MPPAELRVRPLTAAEMDRFIEVDRLNFLELPLAPEDLALMRGWLETDRTIGLFEDAEMVGGVSMFTLTMTVPEGRQVPMAGVTWASVLSTHRRRGGLRAMMRHQLDTLHETGAEPVAGLTATDPALYGRYGYGLAANWLDVTVPRHKNTLRLPEGTGDVRLRYVELSEILDLAKEIYNRQVARRPGMVARPDWFFDVLAADPDFFRGGRTKQRTVLAERDGVPVGYTRYYAAQGESGHRIDVNEVQADDPIAAAALWDFVLNIGLAATMRVSELPVDDPLLRLLEDPRSATPRLKDGLHVRLVDLDRALTARSYATPVDVVFDVVDEFCPWNAGRWRLAGDEKGATCTRTDSPADIRLDVRELGSAYLGGTTMSALETAGFVAEQTKGAVRAASRAFASDIQPFLSLHF